MPPIKIFLASSAELEAERRAFEIFIQRKNKAWQSHQIFLELQIWEDFHDAMSKTRSQDEYNKAVRSADIFVLLYFSKVGKYTFEEFEVARQQFLTDGKRPQIFIFEKHADLNTGNLNRTNLNSLLDFKEKLSEIGHFPTIFKNEDGLIRKFSEQLEKLDDAGFFPKIEVKPRPAQPPAQAVFDKKLLTDSPLRSPEFMENSRDPEIEDIKKRTAGAKKAIVLQGQGGEGKTSILSKFYEQHGADFQHVAWIFGGNTTAAQAFSQSKLVDTLRPAMPRWRDDWDADQKLEHLADILAADERSGLLLLDNFNEAAELHRFRHIFEKKLHRWTCLIASRDPKTKFEQVLPVRPLEANFAHRLFVRHWLGDEKLPSESDSKLLFRLLDRIKNHALLVEILAKHLRARRSEGKPDSLPALVEQLSTKGILGLPKTDAIEVEWQGASGTPLQILEKLFDLDALPAEQQTLLLRFAILPAAPMPQQHLQPIFGIEESTNPEAAEHFTQEISRLAARGWLDFEDKKGYWAHALVAEFVRGKLLPDFERCRIVVENLWKILQNWKISDSKNLLAGGVSVLENLNFPLEMDILELACATADGFQAIGDLNNAERFFKKYLVSAEKLATENAGVEKFEREFAVANSRMGDLALALGKPSEARLFFKKNVLIFEKLAAVNPDSEDIQRNFAVANSKMGDLALALGKPSEARLFFEKYLQIAEKLAAANPYSEQNQREWGASNSRMGDILLALGQISEARLFFEKHLQISEKLAAANPYSEQNQREWGSSNSRMGDILLALGQISEARLFFEKHLQVSEKLAAANPDSEEIQREWAVSNSKMGDLALALEQPSEARLFFEKDLQISEKLAAANPDSEEIQRDWAVSNNKIGNLIYKTEGASAALPFFEKYHEIFEKLVSQNPETEKNQRELAVALQWLGILEIQSGGDKNLARVRLEHSLKILEARLAINPLSADLKKLVETVQGLLA